MENHFLRAIETPDGNVTGDVSVERPLHAVLEPTPKWGRATLSEALTLDCAGQGPIPLELCRYDVLNAASTGTVEQLGQWP
jgi:hypothetical protein